MINEIWFDRIPLWVLFFLTIAVVILSITAGFYLGLWRRKQAAETISGPVGSIVGAMLGLLAFILAFTFGMSASRFDARKQLLLDEVNAAETAFLRAGLIAEPQRVESRDVIKKYVDLRLSIAQEPRVIHKLLLESQKLQDELWDQAVKLVRAGYNAEIESLFIQSVNDLINLHTVRVTTALQYRIPLGVWAVLFLLTIFTMAAVGYQFGLCGKSSYVVYILLSIGFSLIIMIIADLDSATRGRLTVNQQPMILLRERLSGYD